MLRLDNLATRKSKEVRNMVIHYNFKKQASNYINGDLDEAENQELNNSLWFMLKVFSQTKDKSYYNNCSDDLKSNFQFVKELLKIFKTDIQFISMVADSFLSKRTTNLNELILEELDVEAKEIIIIMNNLIDLSKPENQTYKRYQLQAQAIYDKFKRQLKIHLEQEFDTDMIGYGFYYITDIYQNSKVIIDFFATKIISEIFNSKAAEYYFAARLNVTSYIKENSLFCYIIDFIKRYDQNLASYTSLNKYLVDDIIKAQRLLIEKEGNKKRLEKEIQQIILDLMIERYIFFQNNQESVFSQNSPYEILCYIIHKLKLSEQLKGHNANLDIEINKYKENEEAYTKKFEPKIITMGDIDFLVTKKKKTRKILIGVTGDFSNDLNDDFVPPPKVKKKTAMKTNFIEAKEKILKKRQNN